MRTRNSLMLVEYEGYLFEILVCYKVLNKKITILNSMFEKLLNENVNRQHANHTIENLKNLLGSKKFDNYFKEELKKNHKIDSKHRFLNNKKTFFYSLIVILIIIILFGFI